MADIEELYQAIILDHNTIPRNYGILTKPTHAVEGLNPLCGDEVKLQLLVENNRIREIRFCGQGCAISKASASMMTETVAGKSVEEALEDCRILMNALGGDGDHEAFPEDSELISLLGVKLFPARIKCATLAWHALLGALEGRPSVSTEEA